MVNVIYLEPVTVTIHVLHLGLSHQTAKMGDHCNQTVTMTMPMATNAVGIPLVTHTVVFNSENVACESVNHNDGGVAIQPQEIKTDCYEKEIKEECMDVTPNFHSSDISAFIGLMDVKPMPGLDDIEPIGHLGLVYDIKPEVGGVSVEDSSEEKQIALGQPIEIIPRPEIYLNDETELKPVVESEISDNPVNDLNADLFCDVPYHKNNRPIPCFLCPLRFLSEKGLRLHMKRHFADSYYPCVFCGKYFAERSGLQGHVIIKHPCKRKCKTCGEMVSNADRSTHKHTAVHMGPKRTKRRVTCSDCGNSYINRYNLAKHVCKARSTVSLSVRPYLYGVCQKKFNTQDNLDEHETKMQTHEPERNVPCEVCGEYFRSVHYRDKHMKKQHPEVKRNKCSYCGMVFKKHAPFLQHVKRHWMVDDKHQCDICGAKFKEEFLAFHMAAKHGGPLPRECEKCGERFMTVKNLKKHTRDKHSEEQPPDGSSKADDIPDAIRFPWRKKKNFKCKHCHRAYSKMKHLTRHVKHHFKIVLPFPCDLCDSTFQHEEGRIRHVWMRHGGPMPYSCKQCGEGFSAKGVMIEHIKALHGPQRHTGNETSKGLSSGTTDNDKCDDFGDGEMFVDKEIKSEGYSAKGEMARHIKALHGPQQMGKETSGCTSSESTSELADKDECDGENYLNREIKTENQSDAEEESNIKTERQFEDQEESHVCLDCGAAYSTKFRLMSHACSSPGHVTPLICPICWEGFKSEHEYDNHMARHKAEDECICLMCPQRFNTCFRRDRHIRREHLKEGVIRQCLYCSATFRKSARVDHHEKRKHTAIMDVIKNKREYCKLCPARFETGRLLDRHILTDHGGLSLHNCDVCGEEFTCEQKLKDHVRNDHQDYPEQDYPEVESSDCPMECETSNSL